MAVSLSPPLSLSSSKAKKPLPLLKQSCCSKAKLKAKLKAKQEINGDDTKSNRSGCPDSADVILLIETVDHSSFISINVGGLGFQYN